jgi:hypothetical protein
LRRHEQPGEKLHSAACGRRTDIAKLLRKNARDRCPFNARAKSL